MQRVPIYSTATETEPKHRMLDIVSIDETGELLIETKSKSNGMLRVEVDEIIRIINRVFHTNYRKGA